MLVTGGGSLTAEANNAVDRSALRAQTHEPFPAQQGSQRWLADHPGKASVKMVWVALGVFGAVMLFALLALLRHG